MRRPKKKKLQGKGFKTVVRKVHKKKMSSSKNRVGMNVTGKFKGNNKCAMNTSVRKSDKKVVFEDRVTVTYVESKEEGKMGIVKSINVKDNKSLERPLFPSKSILKISGCKDKPLKGQSISDNYWYPNWKKDVQRSREKTQILYWYRMAIMIGSVDMLRIALDV